MSVVMVLIPKAEKTFDNRVADVIIFRTKE